MCSTANNEFPESMMPYGDPKNGLLPDIDPRYHLNSPPSPTSWGLWTALGASLPLPSPAKSAPYPSPLRIHYPRPCLQPSILGSIPTGSGQRAGFLRCACKCLSDRNTMGGGVGGCGWGVPPTDTGAFRAGTFWAAGCFLPKRTVPWYNFRLAGRAPESYFSERNSFDVP